MNIRQDRRRRAIGCERPKVEGIEHKLKRRLVSEFCPVTVKQVKERPTYLEIRFPLLMTKKRERGEDREGVGDEAGE